VVVVVVVVLVVTGARTTVLEVVVDVDVEVLVVVVELAVQAPHMLPGPPETPPAATHVASSRVMRERVLAQSASVSQASQGLLLQTPWAVPSPGARSSQLPMLLVQHTTAPGLPQLESAAQRIMRTVVPALQPAFRSALP